MILSKCECSEKFISFKCILHTMSFPLLFEPEVVSRSEIASHRSMDCCDLVLHYFVVRHNTHSIGRPHFFHDKVTTHPYLNVNCYQ